MTTLKCDHCNQELGPDQRQMICVAVKSHVPDETGTAVPARVNTQRWWRFCDRTCADDWYAAPTDDHFLPMGPAPAALPCEAHPEGEHDFSAGEHDNLGPAKLIVQGGQIVVETADGTLVPHAEWVASSSAPPSCDRCGKAPHEVLPAAPHLISEGEQRDRLLRMVAVHVVPSKDPELCDHQIFDEPAHLNDYWKTSGPAEPMPTDPSAEKAS